MKRDMELVRKILFYFEDKTTSAVERNLEIEGYDEHLVAYHYGCFTPPIYCVANQSHLRQALA